MRSFKTLTVWEKAHQLTLLIYKATSNFPSDERFGLTSQLRRSCSSIAANIAEGCGRGSDNELRRFLEIAMGSASETEYHLLLARDLGHLKQQQHAELDEAICEVKRMLASFIKKLKADNYQNKRSAK